MERKVKAESDGLAALSRAAVASVLRNCFSICFLVVCTSAAFAQPIRITLQHQDSVRLFVDSANWNEAWIEVTGRGPAASKLDTASVIVREGSDRALIVRVDSIGARFESHLALSFVLDNSGSMFHAYDSLTKYCDSLLDSLARGVRIQAVTFDNTDRSESHLFTKRASTFIAQSGFRDSASDIRSFWHFFDTVRTRYTPLYDAVAAALSNIQTRNEHGDTAHVDVLVVVTDGEDNASRLDVETLEQLVAVSHVKLFAINFRSEPNGRLMWLAARSKGAFYYADDLEDLRSLIHDLARSMTRFYHVLYRFPSLGPSTFHK